MLKILRLSFYYAFKGCAYLLRERNFLLHIVSAIAVIILGLACKLEKQDWIVVILCIGMVMAAEAFNTALEKLCDHLHPERHAAIAKVKDISAAAVLIICIAAAIVGVMIFLPYF